jgi:MerR HTH family regulatory protein
MTSRKAAATKDGAAPAAVMTIGALARRTGVPVKTLREYEDLRVR